MAYGLKASSCHPLTPYTTKISLEIYKFCELYIQSEVPY